MHERTTKYICHEGFSGIQALKAPQTLVSVDRNLPRNPLQHIHKTVAILKSTKNLSFVVQVLPAL